MSRLIGDDFNRLITYFNEYNLKTVITKDAFERNAKSIHRKLYAFLVLTNELEQQSILSSSEDILRKLFKEIGSDLILSFFCWVNGAYKPAELQLRSSIENFVKAFLYKQFPQIIMTKSVYEIFDLAENSDIFNNKICYSHYSVLRNEYASLCAYVHSSMDKLAQNEALIQLPKYNNALADEFCTHFQNVANKMLSISYYTYYDNVFLMHTTNRDLFLQGLLKKDKQEIYSFRATESA